MKVIKSIFVLAVLFCGFFYILTVCSDTSEPYISHDPIIVEGAPSSPENPYIIDGYEITNPDGPGIQIRHVDYVVIRNNYVHDCGTEISEAIQEEIKDGGLATLAVMDEPFKTGGILVFDAKHIEIYNNTVINNDYGIKVWGHRFRAESVSVHDNEVKESHRSFFISVSKADNVDITDNHVEDNGLSIFIDNEGLEAAFERGEDFGDGRSQGILTDGCNHVTITGNTVINSSSDGIGVTQGELEYVEGIEIAHNTVLRNGEQGLWLVKARNGTIHDNIISENRHRIDTTGGSSGIEFEGEVFDFKIYNNEISYNDMFGIYFINSSDNEIYNNEIHHNGDGAIGWGEIFYWDDEYYAGETISGELIVRDNDVHHNRMAVFKFLMDFSKNFTGKIIVDGNTFTKNGGNPIHYEFYDDFDMTAHLEEWEYDGESVMLLGANEEFIDLFEIGTNTTDGEEVTGFPREEKELEKTAPPEEEEKKTQEPPTYESKESEPLPEPDESDNTAYFIVFVIVIVLLAGVLRYTRRKSN
ncbi:MAG: right-handed parallel beta-helix repeat-containing protein [Euryarchaeota archaeon]|nr:right-handed parallel beta-helix repeat-containing protein [Euryarchaeota archaeon]